VLCPCLIYGAYVFLPFDAPLMPTVSARLVYTLRCAAFATFPIVLGAISQHLPELSQTPRAPFPGQNLLGTVPPQPTKPGPAEREKTGKPITSASPPRSPRSAPTSVLSRLIYWVSYAIGRSFRAFGFSLTFLPLLAMLLWNLYSMLVLEPHNLLA
ncbi:TMM79 protein, partial [Centropus bengalensis]|nr:TMM79 protein [Centropus bengalensis]